VLELGTFTGFAALMMAAALPPDGELVTCESDARAPAVAQRYFDRSPTGARIRLLVGRAEELLGALEPGFGLIFVDIGATAGAEVYERCLELLAPGPARHRQRPGARHGPRSGQRPRARPRRAQPAHRRRPPRRQVMLTVRDGLMLIRRTDEPGSGAG